MLGHKDAATTLIVYTSLSEDDLDDVSNTALTRPCWKLLRPESSAEIIELPERIARTML